MDEKELMELPAKGTIILSARDNETDKSYLIKNFMIGPEESLSIHFSFD
jgi:hypothetical protein